MPLGFSGIAEIRLGRKFVEYTPVVTVTRSDGKIISSADPSRTFYPGQNAVRSLFSKT